MRRLPQRLQLEQLEERLPVSEGIGMAMSLATLAGDGTAGCCGGEVASPANQDSSRPRHLPTSAPIAPINLDPHFGDIWIVRPQTAALPDRAVGVALADQAFDTLSRRPLDSLGWLSRGPTRSTGLANGLGTPNGTLAGQQRAGSGGPSFASGMETGRAAAAASGPGRTAPVAKTQQPAAASNQAGPAGQTGGGGSGFRPAAAGTVNTLTFHGDSARTGWNANETILTPANVAANFGNVWNSPVLDSVTLNGVTYAPHMYASPLYVDSLAVTSGPYAGNTVGAVIAATSTGYVYAIKAFDTAAVTNIAPGTILWRTSLGQPTPTIDGGVTVGVLSTPTIDLSTNRLYVTSDVTDSSGRNWDVFALDLGSGNVLPGWPLQINSATLAPINQNGPTLWGGTAAMSQRSALNLSPDGSLLYVSFGTYVSNGGAGWMVAVNTRTPSLVSAFAGAPSNVGTENAGMWGSGGAAIDSNGDVLDTTGNSPAGSNNTPGVWGNSLLEWGPGTPLSLVGTYTPWNYNLMDQYDTDLAGSSPVVMDLDPATTSTPYLAAFGGKQGNAYLVDRANLKGSLTSRPPPGMPSYADTSLLPPGHQPQFNAPGPLNIFGPYSETSNNEDYAKARSTPAYFQGPDGSNYVLFSGSAKAAVNSVTPAAPSLVLTKIVTTPGQPAYLAVVHQNTAVMSLPGSAVISSNGTANPIAWVVDAGVMRTDSLTLPTTIHPTLYAYDALTLQPLWSSAYNELDVAGKYYSPTIAHGTVFVGTDRIQAFGLTSNTNVDDSVQGTGPNQINYQGSGWTHLNPSGVSGTFDTTVSYDSTANDAATISFTGGQIRLYANELNTVGIAGVSIDGGPESMVDLYSASPFGDVLVYTSPTLAAGTHTLKVRNTGTKDANSSGTTITIDRFTITASNGTLGTSNTVVTSSANPSVAGNPVTFTATVSGSGSSAAPTGTLQWQIDGRSSGNPVPVSTTGGITTATFTTSGLSGGTHTITANYLGDSTYQPSTGSLQQTVNSTTLGTTTTVTSSANPQTAGYHVSWTATVTAATGGVNFVNFETGDFSQAATRTGGAIVTSPALSGNYSLQLQRSGSVADYEIRQSGTTYYNLPTAYYRFLFESTNNPGEGGIANFQDTSGGFKAALHLSAANKLLFYDSTGTLVGSGTTTLNSGQVYAISAMVGTGSNAAWQILINGNVEMSGTGNLGSNNNGSLNLGGNGAYTTTYYYDDVAINSQSYPGPVPTGTVQFVIDGSPFGSPVPLSDGMATSTRTSMLSVGNHTVVANYSGDSTYASGSGSLPGGQTINGQSMSGSMTTVSSSLNPSVFGQSVTFTATVGVGGPSAPTGTVTFLDGSTTLGQGTLSPMGGSNTATFSTSSLAVGTHTITASYSGDSTYTGSSGSLTQTVNPVNQGSTTTAVASSSNPSTPGQSVTFTARIMTSGSGTAPTGTVQWLVDSLKQGSPVPVSTTGGVTTATLTLSTLNGGTHTITASYSGDSNYQPSSGSLQQTVNGTGLSTTTTVTSSANPQTAGYHVGWAATVTAATGAVNFVNFETGDFSQAATRTGGAIVTSPALSGKYSLQLLRSGSVANYEVRQSGTTYYNLPTAYYRFLFETTSNPGEGGIVNFQDTASGFKAALHLSPTNKLLFYDSTGTLVATGSTTLNSGQVYALSAMIGTGSTAAWQILLNGNVEISGTGNLGSTNNGSLSLGGNGAYTTTYYYDDVAINSQSYPGPVPTGTVQFVIDGSPYASPMSLSDGMATSPLTSMLSPGTHTVTANYSGDSTYASSSGALPGGQIINPSGAAMLPGVYLSASLPASDQMVGFTMAVSQPIRRNPVDGFEATVRLPGNLRRDPAEWLSPLQPQPTIITPD